MARAAWNGSISFGLVQIPVELHPGDESRELSFTLLDKRDLSPVGYQRINKSTGQVVPYEAIVKGYEHAKGQFVVLQASDFVKANVSIDAKQNKAASTAAAPRGRRTGQRAHPHARRGSRRVRRSA